MKVGGVRSENELCAVCGHRRSQHVSDGGGWHPVGCVHLSYTDAWPSGEVCPCQAFVARESPQRAWKSS